MKFLFELLSVLFTFHSISASDSLAIEPEYVKHLRTYASYLGIDISIDSSLTSKKTFVKLCEVMERVNTAGGRIPHDHVSQGLRYGNSFTLKNEELIEFIAKLLSGQKNWKKETIEGTALTIADLGCGLGLSTLMLVSKLVSVFEGGNWELASPIRIDLLDRTPEHQPALQALVGIINAAYAKYFYLETRICDVKEPFASGLYNITMAINLMHYIPEVSWRLTYTNIENAMKVNGMLFITTEPYQIPLLSLSSPFYVQASSLFSEEEGGNKYGATIWNPYNIKYLKDGVEFTPGKKYTHTEIDIVSFELMLKKHLDLTRASRLNIKVSLTVKDAIRCLDRGEFAVRAGCYCFDSELLAGAITQTLAEDSRLRMLSKPDWVEKIKSSRHGATIGITLTKAKATGT